VSESLRWLELVLRIKDGRIPTAVFAGGKLFLLDELSPSFYSKVMVFASDVLEGVGQLTPLPSPNNMVKILLSNIKTVARYKFQLRSLL